MNAETQDKAAVTLTANTQNAVFPQHYSQDIDGVTTPISALTEKLKQPIPLSRGEKIFDWLVYAGIGGAGVFASTLPVTYWAKHGGGQHLFAKGVKALEHTRLQPKTIQEIMMTTALSMTGNASIIPIKIFEDHKMPIVAKLNKSTGENPDAPLSSKSNPQTWGSLIKGRVLAWVAVFVSFKTAADLLGGDKFAQYENKFAENVVCKPFGKATHIGGEETKLFRYGKIAALDVYATVAATTLLYLGSRLFAKKSKPHIIASSKDEPILQPEAIAPAATSPEKFSDKLVAPKPTASYIAKLASERNAPETPSSQFTGI